MGLVFASAGAWIMCITVITEELLTNILVLNVLFCCFKTKKHVFKNICFKTRSRV